MDRLSASTRPIHPFSCFPLIILAHGRVARAVEVLSGCVSRALAYA